MGHRLNLSAVTKVARGLSPPLEAGSTLTLTSAETVEQAPRATVEVETWLSDSRVAYQVVVEPKGRRPFFAPPSRSVRGLHVLP